MWFSNAWPATVLGSTATTPQWMYRIRRSNTPTSKSLTSIVTLSGLGRIVLGLAFFLLKACLTDFSPLLIVDVSLATVFVDCWLLKIIWYISLEKKKSVIKFQRSIKPFFFLLVTKIMVKWWSNTCFLLRELLECRTRASFPVQQETGRRIDLERKWRTSGPRRVRICFSAPSQRGRCSCSGPRSHLEIGEKMYLVINLSIKKITQIPY